MQFKRYQLFVPFILLGLFLSACSSKDNRVLGSIEGEKYTVDSFLSLFLTPDMIKENKKNISDTDISAGFEQLASFVIFAGEADKSGFFKNNPKLEEKLATQSESIKKAAYQRYIDQTIIKPMMDKVTVSDKELEPYKKRVQVRHILLSNDGSMKDPVKGKALEAEILKELDKGTNFADLAKKYSEDPGSKDAGGLISQWIYEDSAFVPEFKTAALGATKNKQVIPDVKTQYGLHIIYIENIQNRSVSDIKDSDPQIYNKILQTKKNEVSQKFEKELTDNFTIEKTPNLDLKAYFKSYNESKGNDVLFTINKTTKYTGKQFVQDVLQNNTKQIPMLLTVPDIDAIVKNYGVMPIVMDLYAQKKGIDKDSFVQNSVRIQITALKANLYMEDLVTKKGPKKQTMPKYNPTDKEIQDFYNTNKAMFSKTTDDGKTTTTTPLTADLKKQITSMMIQSKQQEFKQEESNKMMNFIQEEAKKHYTDYKVTFNEEFLKKTPVK